MAITFQFKKLPGDWCGLYYEDPEHIFIDPTPSSKREILNTLLHELSHHVLSQIRQGKGLRLTAKSEENVAAAMADLFEKALLKFYIVKENSHLKKLLREGRRTK